MSDEEVKKLKEQLSSKQAALNELFHALQDRDRELRQLGDERSKLYNQVEDLQKKLKRTEGRLADRERDHYILLESMRLYSKAFQSAVDAMDEIDAAIDVGDPKSDIKKITEKFLADTMQAREAGTHHYARKAQERLLLQVWKKGELTQELREELGRFMESHKEYLSDADNWAEVEEMLTRSRGPR